MKAVSAEVIHKDLYSKCISPTFYENNLSLYREIGMEIKASEIVNSIEFPHLKRILFRDVIDICKKYNLVVAPIERFTGQIPNKNLTEIFDFIKIYQRFCYKTWNIFNDNENIISIKGRDAAEKAHRKFHWVKAKSSEVKAKYSLFICAPKDQLIIRKNEKIKGRKVITDDPIVLALDTFKRLYSQPLEEDIMTIITAWGTEASDSGVINEKLN